MVGERDPETARAALDGLAKYENARRIDQRWNQDHRRSVAAMVAQCCAANARDFLMRRRRLHGRRSGIGAQAREGVPGERGIFLRDAPHQLQEQRQRPRRAFMLQRTMIR